MLRKAQSLALYFDTFADRLGFSGYNNKDLTSGLFSMLFSLIRAGLSRAGLLSASLALFTAQSASAALLYSNDFDNPAYLEPTAVLTTPLTNGVFPYQTAVSNIAWPTWKDNYFANQTLQSTVLELSNLPAHDQVDINFILGFLGSWDSTDGYNPPYPDYLKIVIDNNPDPILMDLTTNNAIGTVQYYAGGTVLGHIVSASSNYVYLDTLVDMGAAPALTIPHTGSTLKLEIMGYGSGYSADVTWPPGGSGPAQPVPPAVWDEGWGIDSLSISYRVPGPLPVLGAASAFAFSRKLRRRIALSGR